MRELQACNSVAEVTTECFHAFHIVMNIAHNIRMNAHLPSLMSQNEKCINDHQRSNDATLHSRDKTRFRPYRMREGPSRKDTTERPQDTGVRLARETAQMTQSIYDHHYHDQ